MRSHLFAYGTLLVPEIIARVIGRVPLSEPAVLQGYRRVTVADEVFPAVFPEASSTVEGLRYWGVGAREVELLDRYEGDLYQRVTAPVLVSGVPSLSEVYVLRAGLEHLLSSEPWELDHFLKFHARTYTWQ